MPATGCSERTVWRPSWPPWPDRTPTRSPVAWSRPSWTSASPSRETTWPSWSFAFGRALRLPPKPCRHSPVESGPLDGAMLLQVERVDSPRGFRLVGELDASNVGVLSDALNRELDKAGDLTLDLAGLAFMDSSGIQALMRAAQGLEGHGRLILRSPGDLVRRILSLIPMDKLANVEVVDDEET